MPKINRLSGVQCLLLLSAATISTGSLAAEVESATFAVNADGNANVIIGAESTDGASVNLRLTDGLSSASAMEGFAGNISPEADGPPVIDFQNGVAAYGLNARAEVVTSVTQRVTNNVGDSQGLFFDSVFYSGSIGFMVPDFSAPGCALDSLFECNPEIGASVQDRRNVGEVSLLLEVFANGTRQFDMQLGISADGSEGDFEDEYTFDIGDRFLLDDFSRIEPTVFRVGTPTLGFTWDTSDIRLYLGDYDLGDVVDVEFRLTTLAQTGLLGNDGIMAFTCFGDPAGGGLAGGGTFFFNTFDEFSAELSTDPLHELMADSAPSRASISDACSVEFAEFDPGDGPPVGVPGPGGLALFGLAALGLGLRRRLV